MRKLARSSKLKSKSIPGLFQTSQNPLLFPRLPPSCSSKLILRILPAGLISLKPQRNKNAIQVLVTDFGIEWTRFQESPWTWKSLSSEKTVRPSIRRLTEPEQSFATKMETCQPLPIQATTFPICTVKKTYSTSTTICSYSHPAQQLTLRSCSTLLTKNSQTTLSRTLILSTLMGEQIKIFW